jgi:hypothetical protein
MGCEGHERRWQTGCRSGTRGTTWVVSRTNSLARSGISLSKRDQPLQAGSRLAQARRTAGRVPSRCDACWASARQARPESGEDAAGRSLPSGRTERRPQDQLTWLATRRGDCAVVGSQADVPECVSGIARLARDTARAIIDREVETAQTDGQPAPRTMDYHHDISGYSGQEFRGPTSEFQELP